MAVDHEQRFRIGLLGYGTVGSAFAELVVERADSIATGFGVRPEIVGILRRSQGSFDEILADSDVVVELIGGIDPARTYVREALQQGKHVVTANKQLISQYGDELLDLASQHGVQLRFEAAVAGVVPVVRVVEESLAGAHIEKVHGIVNGTTNFILSEMAQTGADYAACLMKAQELGYAEADPTEDVNGKDAAAKMAILARLAFHCSVRLDQVEFEGIEDLTPDDIAYAREFGLSLKLLGVAERLNVNEDEGISVRVYPCFLYSGHPLAAVIGPYNAVTMESPAITEVTLSGPGAGGPQTASAVLGDVVSAMTGTIGVLPTPRRATIIPGELVSSAFYLHVEVKDEPGALAQIAQYLGDSGVSVKSAAQKGLGDNARLIMVMHPVEESRFQEALKRIAGLDVLRAPPRVIRVIEEEFV